MSILEEIYTHKKNEVAEAKSRTPGETLLEQIRKLSLPIDFKAALVNETLPAPRLIAEVKYKSPSKGILSNNFDPISLAQTYASHGAAAISVLTDEKYFGGGLDILSSIAKLGLSLPLLRKDFLFDSYQLLEARAAGASAILLITAMLNQEDLVTLIEECETLKMTALVEVHDEVELDRALSAGAQVIGINNRNLHDFSVSLETSIQLVNICPPEVVLISESGIKTPEDVEKLAQVNFDAVLVGETLVTAQDIGIVVQNLTRVSAR
ncbi:MAG: indole-3-glycerol phosphate synthase TrpC [Anaerolineales bacterium]|jgi:indole-3-glycerol phosphate synthase